MPWGYFKTFLEGGPAKVSVPKNKGSNFMFKDPSPVVGTLPEKIQFFLKGPGGRPQSHPSETHQMDNRMNYIPLRHEIPQDQIVDCETCISLEHETGAQHRVTLDIAFVATLFVTSIDKEL